MFTKEMMDTFTDLDLAVYDCIVKNRGRISRMPIKIRQGDEAFTEGHHIHADLLAQDANGELNESGLILMHAEDRGPAHERGDIPDHGGRIYRSI